MNYKICCFVATLTLLFSCSDDYTPRPKGYIRFEFLPKSYTYFQSSCPFLFRNSTASIVSPAPNHDSDLCWLNVYYPAYKATIHLSYKKVENNLDKLLSDTRKMTNKHISKADNIRKTQLESPKHNVYGMIYEVEGDGAASALQFYLTDSTHHFIRGALYFNAPANNDSLGPVISYIKTDIDTLIQSFRWQE